jgi:hypothetical protein
VGGGVASEVDTVGEDDGEGLGAGVGNSKQTPSKKIPLQEEDGEGLGAGVGKMIQTPPTKIPSHSSGS